VNRLCIFKNLFVDGIIFLWGYLHGVQLKCDVPNRINFMALMFVDGVELKDGVVD
jgi:hypothetical protein